jgi:hypothetical protein
MRRDSAAEIGIVSSEYLQDFQFTACPRTLSIKNRELRARRTVSTRPFSGWVRCAGAIDGSTGSAAAGQLFLTVSPDRS